MKRLILVLSVVAMSMAMAPIAFAGSPCPQGSNAGRGDNTTQPAQKPNRDAPQGNSAPAAGLNRGK